MKRSAQNTWVQCPAGELTRLADRLRMRRLWNRSLLAGALVVLLVTAVVVGGWLVPMRPGFGPISGAAQPPADDCSHQAPEPGCPAPAP